MTVAASADPTSGTTGGARWNVVGIGALTIGLGASLGFVPGFIATALRDDLDISRAEVGLLVSVHFGCTGLGSVLAGRLTERIGARLAVALDMVAVGIGAAVVAVIGSYWALMIAAVVGGAGYAMCNVGTNVALARAVPLGRRTLAMSLKTAGVPTMALVGAAISPWAADRAGWEVVYVATAVIAGLGAVAAFAVLPPDRPTAVAVTSGGPLPRGFVWFAVGAFLLVGGTQPMYSWLVPYLEEGLDASPAVAGVVASTAVTVGVIVMALNGVGADRIGADRRVPLLVALTAASAASTLVILSGLSIGLTGAVLGATVGIATQLAAIGTMHAAIIDRAPDAVPRATGVTMTGYYLGALVSPVGFGALTDATDTYGWSWLAMAAMVTVGAAAFARTARVGPPG